MPDPNSYQAIGWLLIALSGLFVIVNQGLKLVDRLKDRPPASEVRAESADKFVPKLEFQKHVDRNDLEHDNIWKKIGGMERGITGEMHEMERRLAAQDEERSANIHTRLDDILRAVANVQGQLAAQQHSAGKPIARP